jgi:hypothetical protein
MRFAAGVPEYGTREMFKHRLQMMARLGHNSTNRSAQPPHCSPSCIVREAPDHAVGDPDTFALTLDPTKFLPQDTRFATIPG